MKKITLIGGSGFVGTNLSNYLHLNNVPFEIIDLKMSNKFSEYCKIGDVRNIKTLDHMHLRIKYSQVCLKEQQQILRMKWKFWVLLGLQRFKKHKRL